MSVNVRLPEGAGPARIAGFIDRLVRWLARHWLASFNLLVALFIGLPVLAPVLNQLGAEGPARLIYTIYAPTCHQLPERSFFLFGPQVVYSVSDLETQQALPDGLNIFQRQALRFNGVAATGYKIALCQRDLAIYGSVLLGGLLFGVLRGRLMRGSRKLPKLPIWMFAVLSVPMFLDGVSQLLGLRESWWLLRLLTGGLFGSAVVWLAYPYVEEAMQDVLNPPDRGSARAPDHAQPSSVSEGHQTGQKPPSAV